jgi:uncharacterized repeat protein (TIGR02543 family)
MSSYNGFRTGSNSYGQFWFGGNSFPGFLYKKNVGVGTRRSTQFTPGGTITCNQPNYLYNKYKPGNGGVGASSISNRRAKNRLATVCVNNNCFPCFSTLGQYSNYTHNPNGFIPCPGTINITNSSSTPSPSGTYTVRYLGNGSNGGFVPVDGSSPYIPGSTVTVLSNTFTRSGYIFAGWSTNSGGTGSDYNGGDLFIINANTTLYAQWIPIIIGDYTLTYDGNGGTGSEPALTTEYPGGTNVTVLGNSGPLTKPGVAVFAGWNTAADGTGSNYVGGDTFNITQNTTLYAQWIVAGSRIRYFAGAGGSGSAPSSSGTYYTPFSNAVIANNTGSFTNTISPVFAGWNTAANGSGTSYPVGSNITMPASGTVDLYAQWIPAGSGPFTLTYAAGTGGTGTPPSSSGNSYSAGSPANIVSNTGSFSNATLPVFNGWNSAADGSGTSYPAGSKITMTSDTTLYAQWGSSPPVTVTYIANGATGTIPVQTYPTGAQATILGQSSLTRPGYSFLGWNTSEYGTGSIYQPTSSEVINSSIQLYAQWASGTAIKDCGSFTGNTQSTSNIYFSGSRTVYRDNINNTITIIIPTFYSDNGAPYGTGTGPSDTGGPTHSGNLKSTYAKVTIGPISNILNIIYTAAYTIGTYTQTSTLTIPSTYWPTGETISTVTIPAPNNPATFIFDPAGTNISVSSGCFGGGSYSSGTTTQSSVISFYINFSNGTSTRVAIGTQQRWTGTTNPYTYVFNYTRAELAIGPTPSPITNPFTPSYSTGVNTPNV